MGRTAVHLTLQVMRKGVFTFLPLLRQGVQVEGQVGCTIGEFLADSLGLPPEYVEERIQTVFLDGRPVDDLNTAMVFHGSTLTLSAAMPGLAGAALRRGGFFAPMRLQISLRGGLQAHSREKGRISLKLLNTVAEEVGPELLKRGVWLEGQVLDRFLEKQADGFWAAWEQGTVDGADTGKGEFKRKKWVGTELFLQVKPGSG